MLKKGYGLIITGISGGGKTTVAQELLKRRPSLHHAVRMTTRKPVAGEIAGFDYEFADEQSLMRLKRSGELLYYEKWYDNIYAVKKNEVEDHLKQGQDVLMQAVIPAACKLYKHANIKVVFLTTKDLETQRLRLERRGSSPQGIIKRLSYRNIEHEMSKKMGFFTIINHELNDTLRQVENYFFS